MSRRVATDQHEIVDFIYGDRESSYDVVEPLAGRVRSRSRKPLVIATVITATLVAGAGFVLSVRSENHQEQSTADRSACQQFVKIDDASASTVVPKIDAIAATVRAALTDAVSKPVYDDIRLVAAAYDDIVIKMRAKPVSDRGVASARALAAARLADATRRCTEVLGADPHS